MAIVRSRQNDAYVTLGMFSYISYLPLSLTSYALTELSWEEFSRLGLEYSEPLFSLPSGKPGIKYRNPVDDFTHEGIS